MTKFYVVLGAWHLVYAAGVSIKVRTGLLRVVRPKTPPPSLLAIESLGGLLNAFKYRLIGLFLCRGWAQHIVDRWRYAVSPGSPPFASDDIDFLPCCDISLDFPFRGAYRGLNVPGA